MSQYRLNWKFLLGFLATVAVAGGLLHYRYKQQIGRQAETLMELATAAEQKGEAAKAAGFLRRYLAFRPEDHAARGRLGLLFLRTARQPREFLQAYFVLDETLRGDPERQDIRRKAAELALRLGPDLLSDAQRHLGELLKADQDNGEFLALYAEYYLAQTQFAEAAEQLRLATVKRTDLHGAYVRRARILRDKLDRVQEADDVIAGMLGRQENAGTFRAHLAAAAYWETDTTPPRPKRDPEAKHAEEVGIAAGKAPDEPEVILAVAELSLARAAQATLAGKDEDRRRAIDDARSSLRKGVARHAPALQKVTAQEVAGLDEEAQGKRALVGALGSPGTELEFAL